MYLVAVMDWFSRYVLAWELSNTMEAGFCVAALERACARGRPGPDIFNTDQGSQFTSQAFTGACWTRRDIRISMDGRGRAYDNIFIERLWRSVKYEEVYLHDYPTVAEAVAGLGRWFAFYNHQRPHQAFGGLTPAEMYSLTPPPWRSQPMDMEGEAKRSTASSLALRAHAEAAEQPETTHLNSTESAPS